MKKYTKYLYLFTFMVILMALSACVQPTPTPPATLTPVPTATQGPDTLHKDVVVIRDPKASAYEWDRISTINGRPIFTYALNPGTDNRLYFMYGDKLNVHLTHDVFTLDEDGAVQDKDGYWYYCIANGAFPNGLSAAGYYVRKDHVRDW